MSLIRSFYFKENFYQKIPDLFDLAFFAMEAQCIDLVI